MSFKTTCFNRYIVECKSQELITRGLDGESFNRYIVECKLYYGEASDKEVDVLIDTQWNVNSVYIIAESDNDSFNRYIVECKFQSKYMIVQAMLLF